MDILIVDDSRVSRMMIKGIIETGSPAAKIREAENGDDAIRLVASQKPDICFVDFNMPGMDGLETCAQIIKTCPHSKLNLLTANIQESIRNRAMELGVNFISKPITADKILSAL